MKVAVMTLGFSEDRGEFDTEALERWQADKDVIEVREHFFVHEGAPRWAVMLSYRDGDGEQRGRRETRDWRLEVAEVDRPLYDALRRWRRERAERDGVPVYTLLKNRELAEICRRRPATVAELREVRGIGEAKSAKLGEEVLAVVSATPPAACKEEAKDG
jgi:superfamily II DNA helicase RecQ